MQFAYFMIIIFDNFSEKILFINLLHINYYNSELTKAEIWLYMELANEWFFSTPPLFWNEMKIREVRAHARVSLCRKKKTTFPYIQFIYKTMGVEGFICTLDNFMEIVILGFLSYSLTHDQNLLACKIFAQFSPETWIYIFFMGHQICVFQMLQKNRLDSLAVSSANSLFS